MFLRLDSAMKKQILILVLAILLRGKNTKINKQQSLVIRKHVQTRAQMRNYGNHTHRRAAATPAALSATLNP